MRFGKVLAQSLGEVLEGSGAEGFDAGGSGGEPSGGFWKAFGRTVKTMKKHKRKKNCQLWESLFFWRLPSKDNSPSGGR